MPDNGLAPPNMPWLWRPNSPVGQPNGLGPPMLNYAAPPSDTSQGAGVAAAGQQAWQWLQDQRAESVRQGLLDPDTGLPTQKGVVEGVGQTAQGIMMGTTAPGDVPPPGIVAYHGSPHSFDQFDTSKIGTGEGNQAFGYGLYAADQESTAQSYKGGGYTFQGKRLDPAASWSPESAAAGWFEPPKPGETMGDMIARRAQELQDHGDFMAGSTDSRNHGSAQMYYNAAERLRGLDPADWKQAGHMYQVNIGADPEHFLDWDKPLSEQHPAVQQAFKSLGYEGGLDAAGNPMSGGNIVHSFGNPASTAQLFQQAGIPGIKYLDQGSRSAGAGSHNYVVFDANTIDILRKYGIAGLIAGGGAAAAATQQQQPSQ